jgi:hypothetical protein
MNAASGRLSVGRQEAALTQELARSGRTHLRILLAVLFCALMIPLSAFAQGAHLLIRLRHRPVAEMIMRFKDIAVKKYVVRLSAAEREYLDQLIRKGKSPAQRLMKARILLKADVGKGGEGYRAVQCSILSP